LAIEEHTGVGIEHIDSLAAASRLPVHAIESQAMGLVIGQVHIHRERIVGIPAGGQARAVRGTLEGANIRGRISPSVAELSN